MSKVEFILAGVKAKLDVDQDGDVDLDDLLAKIDQAKANALLVGLVVGVLFGLTAGSLLF
jgi:hypothetical protein